MSKQTSRQPPYARLSEEQAKRMLTALYSATEYAGGWRELARMLSEHTGESVSPQAVFQWTVKLMPAERAVDLEETTLGAVTRQNLRPDLYDAMRSEA